MESLWYEARLYITPGAEGLSEYHSSHCLSEIFSLYVFYNVTSTAALWAMLCAWSGSSGCVRLENVHANLNSKIGYLSVPSQRYVGISVFYFPTGKTTWLRLSASNGCCSATAAVVIEVWLGSHTKTPTWLPWCLQGWVRSRIQIKEFKLDWIAQSGHGLANTAQCRAAASDGAVKDCWPPLTLPWHAMLDQEEDDQREMNG